MAFHFSYELCQVENSRYSCSVFKALLAEKQTLIKSKLINYINAIKVNGFSSESPTSQNQFQRVGFNWETARTPQVLAALRSYGCFDVVYDGVRLEVLFQSIMPKIFALPLEVKQLSKESKYSYLAHDLLTDVAYESINVRDASNPESVENSKNLPGSTGQNSEGNQKFCNTVTTYAQKARILEQIVERMMFQSLGIEKYCNSHLKSLTYGVRFSTYGGLPIEEAKASFDAHGDPVLFIKTRSEGRGLEVYTKNGECIKVVPSLDTSTLVYFHSSSK